MNTEIDIHAPRVVHCRREPFDVYIGRAVPRLGLRRSKWANPYRIGRDGTREECIRKYREYVLGRPDLMKALGELRGKVLGCWCSPEPCHGDVLIELLTMVERGVGHDRSNESRGDAEQVVGQP